MSFAFSSYASEWIEIAQDVFFSRKTGELKYQDLKVFFARNRVRAFICFWEAPDHTVSYPVFCNDVLGRPLSEDESTEENRQLNRVIKKSMTQTIMRLREDLMTINDIPAYCDLRRVAADCSDLCGNVPPQIPPL